MASIGVHRVTNGNLYVDGVSLLGKVAEVMLPQLKTIMSEHAALGLFGKFELPAGLDKMEATIKWNSYYADAMKASGNPFAVKELQLRCSIEEYSSLGRTGEIPGVVFMRGTFKDPSLGNFKQHDNVELETKFNALAVRFEIGGRPVLEIDVLANIYKVDAQDVLATYRLNLGA
jgi:P2 family phage contractile tail tube protein